LTDETGARVRRGRTTELNAVVEMV